MAEIQTGTTPRRFGYLRDPLFLLSVVAFFVIRVMKQMTGDPADFWHCYANDLLCVPIWMPVQLAIFRTNGRKHDDPPTIPEITLMVVLWSWMFEVVMPSPILRDLLLHPVSDPLDAVAYAIGGLAAGLIWRSGWDPVDPSAPGVTWRQLQRIAMWIVLLTTVTTVFVLSYIPEWAMEWREQQRQLGLSAMSDFADPGMDRRAVEGRGQSMLNRLEWGTVCDVRWVLWSAVQGLLLGVLTATAWLVRSSLRPRPWPHLANWPLLRTLTPPALCAGLGIGLLELLHTSLLCSSQ